MGTARQKIKILIVEDQPEIQESIRITLRTLIDFTPEFAEASNGEEGIAQLQSGFLPDAIISDIMMPLMDGFEFCKKVKESHLWCSIPFIFLSAKVEVSSVEHGMHMGAVAYIEKPFDPRVLGAAVQSQVLAYWQLKERLSKSVNTLLSVFSHEAGTALNSIMGFTELLREVPELNQEHQKWLLNIHLSAKRLEKLRRKSAFLIEFQHTETLHPEYGYLPDLLKAVVENNALLMEEKKLEIATQFDEVPPIEMNRALLFEALSVVVENAMQHTPQGRKIYINLQTQDNHVVVSISDEGPGVDSKHALEIFEPFVTVSNVLNHQKGTGLSLAIAKRIVELHKGDLSVENREQSLQGAKFNFRFPQLL